jgi:Uma2 family endonuclease
MTSTSTEAVNRTITEQDLLRWDADGYQVEVVEGRVVPVRLADALGKGGDAVNAAGVLHVELITNIYDILKPYVSAHQLGKVYPEGLHFILAADAEGVRGSRIPDVCFIRKGRFPADFDPRRPFPGAPDLAVEVVSPTESQETVAGKVRDYLAAGTEQVWVVYPEIRQVYQYRQDDPKNIRVYSEGDQLDAAALFPDLTIPIADIFVLEGFD